MRVSDAERWLRKLEALESSVAKIMHVKHLMQRVAARCAEISEKEMETNSSNPSAATAEYIRSQIIAEFNLE